ncbi:adenylate/guanylate cyclase domain-containing protein [Spirochaetia bacterium]|nr:adenylate/guanylate cyclase domain-containing protein [Spirochaetia bacterium]
MTKIRTGKKLTAVCVLSISVFAVVAGSFMLGLFEYPEYKTYDIRVSTLAKYQRPSDSIILILLDQSSIDWAQKERGWAWPWPRRAYAEIIDYLNISGAASFALDVLFSEPSIYDTVRDAIFSRPEASSIQNIRSHPAFSDDERFAHTAADYAHVVQAVFFNRKSGGATAWPDDLNVPVFKPDTALQTLNMPNYENAQFPIEILSASAGALGVVTVTADSDGVFRRTNLFTQFDGRLIPGLSAASLLVSGMDPELTFNEKKHYIEWGKYHIPVDKTGQTLLRFRGSLDRYIPYTAAEILQSSEQYYAGKEILLPPENFKDAYVFFGYYAPGLFDICTTPISSTYPGVGVHITMLDNLLNQDFITQVPIFFALLLCFVVIVAMNVLVLYSGKIPVTVTGAVLLLSGIIVLGFAAYHISWWIPIVAPVIGVIFAFLSATLYNYATEGKQKRFIKSAFSQYLSPTVIEQLVANPERLQLGGERREISIFFSDVQGFTTISEKLDPARLTELLNSYLSFMSDIILDSGGTIDKYEGDAIIAFWNAPVGYPDHSARAIKASIACQTLLAERQEFFEKEYGCRLLTRIGLNTGYAVVGNMGSSKRFDYTMLGDSVNLAARLEGQNKQFGTYLMCTEEMFVQAQKYGTFFGRRLAKLAVVGKTEPVIVYEPMTEEIFNEKQAVISQFDAAYDLFYQGNFEQAFFIFESLKPVDPSSKFYMAQCRYYQNNPKEWKGFWQATVK